MQGEAIVDEAALGPGKMRWWNFWLGHSFFFFFYGPKKNTKSSINVDVW